MRGHIQHSANETHIHGVARDCAMLGHLLAKRNAACVGARGICSEIGARQVQLNDEVEGDRVANYGCLCSTRGHHKDASQLSSWCRIRVF